MSRTFIVSSIVAASIASVAFADKKEPHADIWVTALGGSKPVNASGGLSSFGEAIPAQAIAQVCELTWQLQGRCDGHQVENAKVGLAINQGLFGHGSCTILSV